MLRVLSETHSQTLVPVPTVSTSLRIQEEYPFVESNGLVFNTACIILSGFGRCICQAGGVSAGLKECYSH